MPKSSQYTHYMQRIDVVGYNIIDIEEQFGGLLYMRAEGMNDIGKSKNVYTEGFAITFIFWNKRWNRWIQQNTNAYKLNKIKRAGSMKYYYLLY